MSRFKWPLRVPDADGGNDGAELGGGILNAAGWGI